MSGDIVARGRASDEAPEPTKGANPSRDARGDTYPKRESPYHADGIRYSSDVLVLRIHHVPGNLYLIARFQSPNTQTLDTGPPGPRCILEARRERAKGEVPELEVIKAQEWGWLK